MQNRVALYPREGTPLWEAAVKSAKLHLRKVVGEQVLDYEEMTTVAAQVEACLNSRPLGSLYCHNTDAVAPLTPGHFLIGRPLQAYPELAIECDMSLCRRWVLCQAMVQQFWKWWSREYLQQLQASQKWKIAQTNLAVDDLVLWQHVSSTLDHGQGRCCLPWR